ncbi:transposase [Flavobacterium granuli]|uniref:Transposase IS200-like domain-containing protein n=1 Tax=Flavobacterium granuli TaxID=280093 RepID=A0A1M5NX51_9FLAO|nr:transposase [Flavobacterium granuli]PRZ23430.1 hypothetical protein BC624_105152 [Flavobacterium granuli]SHG94146.1 hypothetical protein SAMN05443373_105152 [Flavobacterium granuli]
MDKYKNKYRTTSRRLPHWDYSSNALYFLTIVTQNREFILGDVINAEMILSEIGKIVNVEFLKSFEIRDELFLCEYVIMPNHIHTIVEICHPPVQTPDPNNVELHDPNNVEPHGPNNIEPHGPNNVEPHGPNNVEPHGPNNVEPHGPNNIEPHGRAVLHLKSESNFNDFSIKRNPPIRLPKSISSFMAGFKSAVNTKIDDYIDEHNLSIPKYNRNNHFFQPNYHDHIIRNNFEYQRITNYIIQNPTKWNSDRLNSDNS